MTQAGCDLTQSDMDPAPSRPRTGDANRRQPLPTATTVDVNHLPDERWDDLARGTIRFRTLFSAPATDSDAITCGVAVMGKGDTFALHSHPQAEVYFGLEGEGEVMVDGVAHRLAPGVALYIPGGAVHGVPLAKAPLRWFYCFAADSFADIRYSFPFETDPAQ